MCYACNKQKIVYPCSGCSQEFCFDCLAKHRQLLGEQLDGFQNECNQLREELIKQKTDTEKCALIQEVNRWVEDSIQKIRQTADECKKILIQHTNKTTVGIETRLNDLADRIRTMYHENEFNELDLSRCKNEIKKLSDDLHEPSKIFIQHDTTSFISKISIANSIITLDNVRWTQDGVTIAGGHGSGAAMNQLHNPLGVYVDECKAIYVADYFNHRIVEWTTNASSGRVVAGGNGKGNRVNQLNEPTCVIVDKDTDSLIICDRGNRRVMKWSRQYGTTNGQIILDNVACNRLTIDDQKYLYIADDEKHDVRRYRMGENNGIIVAGGNGQGDRLNQLNGPFNVFVSKDYSVYVSDVYNHRVMKWVKGEKEGVVVAGGRGKGGGLSHLSNPVGVFVDSLDTVYVADEWNHRVIRWCKGATQGEVIVGGNEKGNGTNQFNRPYAISFDQIGHLYVVDTENHRVQRFSIETI